MIISGPEARAAMRLVLKHWSKRSLPIDPSEIARLEGVAVVGLQSWELDEGVSGAYTDQEDGPKITFNESESFLRQRFTIAHELGHHVLRHGDSFRDSAKAFSLSNYDPKEAAANRFAANLLMPDPVVRNLVVNRGITSLELLADKFKVSQVAMKFRLETLGLI